MSWIDHLFDLLNRSRMRAGVELADPPAVIYLELG
jgi:hypothetical protein